MSRIGSKARRRLVDAKGILLACWGAVARPLLGDRARMFRPGPLQGPYRGRVAAEIAQLVERLSSGGCRQEAFARVHRAIVAGLDAGEFDRWLGDNASGDSKIMLSQAADHLTGRRWKLQLFFVPPGQSHAPHSHTDVSSCLVVAAGRIHAREYDRRRDVETKSGPPMLSLASDGQLERGQALFSTIERRDVHWFSAVGGPAAVFNFQVAGFRRGMRPFEPLREYLDPTGVARSGVHPAPRLKRSTARARFRHQPVSAFPPPEPSGAPDPRSPARLTNHSHEAVS